MDIVFATDSLKKLCNSRMALQRKYGLNKAKKIERRLVDLAAAETLADMSRVPSARCHALKGDYAGKFAVDTIHPYRMIFESANNPVPLLKDGGIDRLKVTAIRILDPNINYHD